MTFISHQSTTSETAVDDLMVHPDFTSCPLTSEQKLQDEIMVLKAKLAGKRMELAHARGNADFARVHMRRMYAVIKARREARLAASDAAGGCYFDAAGQADRLAMRGGAA